MRVFPPGSCGDSGLGMSKACLLLLMAVASAWPSRDRDGRCGSEVWGGSSQPTWMLFLVVKQASFSWWSPISTFWSVCETVGHGFCQEKVTC